MNEVISDAAVTGYEAILSDFEALGKDGHVLAAAVVGRADVIVTRNVRDFRSELTNTYGIDVQSPDEFLVHQWWLSPADAAQVLREQATALNNPPQTVGDVLRSLGKIAPEFAALAQTKMVDLNF